MLTSCTRPPSAPAGNVRCRAVLGQHRVQRDQRLAVRAAPACRNPAVRRSERNPRSAAGPDSSRAKLPVDEYQPRRVHAAAAAPAASRLRTGVSGSWNVASASGRRLVYFQASSRGPACRPAGPRRGMPQPRRRAQRESPGRPSASGPRSAPGNPRDAGCTTSRSCRLRHQRRHSRCASSSCASSGPPERTMRPPASTCTRSGTM